MVELRVVTVADSDELTELLVKSREFLAPFEPRREDSYFESHFQTQLLSAKLAAHEQGSEVPFVIVNGGSIVGQLVLDRMELGPFLTCDIGYWVAEDECGKGIATEAVTQALAYTRDELGLKRITAATLPDNAASIRVLERNGFQKYGLAHSYMEIAGEWRDHELFELVHPSAT